MKKLKKSLTVAVAAAFVVMGCAICNNVFAAEKEAPAYSLSALTWNVDLGSLDPGDTASGSYTIKNVGTEAFTYEAVAKPYTVADDGVTTSYEEASAHSQMVDWIVFDNPTGSVPAQSTQTIYFTVTVPKDVPAGSQYVGLHTTAYPFVEEHSSESSAIQSLVAVAPLLHADINGETHKSANVLEDSVPAFVLNPPLRTTAMIENTGNVGFSAEYFLQVFPLFSDEEIYTNEEKPESGLVLPDSKRYVSQSWDGTPSIGIFKVKQTIKFLDQTSVNEKMVIICPIWLLVLILIAICAVVVWLLSRSKAHKKAKK